jgi:hypothetical protein
MSPSVSTDAFCSEGCSRSYSNFPVTTFTKTSRYPLPSPMPKVSSPGRVYQTEHPAPIKHGPITPTSSHDYASPISSTNVLEFLPAVKIRLYGASGLQLFKRSQKPETYNNAAPDMTTFAPRSYIRTSFDSAAGTRTSAPVPREAQSLSAALHPLPGSGDVPVLCRS